MPRASDIIPVSALSIILFTSIEVTKLTLLIFLISSSVGLRLSNILLRLVRISPLKNPTFLLKIILILYS